MNEETIFATALEKSDPAERAAFLGQACGADAELRSRVEGLLGAQEKAGPFLNRPAVEPDPDKTHSHGDGHDESDDLSAILTPSDRPDSLGRIGHYDVFEVLGRGGFGIVFRAFDDVLQRVVAVKVLNPSMAATSPARKRFLREARSSAQVRHENVVLVHAVEEQPYPFLVMEFVPGETLQQRVDRTGPLDVGEVIRVGRQIADGLAAAHATGLIHRDIKPSNVLIETSPQERVKITDFGLARAADDASLTRSGVVAGTPMYMAPEQARGDTLDHRADLFSLGSVLYLMCTGRPPFRASTTFAVLKRVAEESPRPIRETIPEVPDWFCRIVEKLHAKSPDERYQTAREVANVLADCEKQMQTHAGVKDFSRIPAKRPAPWSPWRYRRFALALWAFVILFWAASWYGQPTFRYVANRAVIEISPAPGLTSVLILQDGKPVGDGMDPRSSPQQSLTPGRYKVEPTFAPGRAIDYWVVTTEGFRSARIVWPGIVPLEFEVARGKFVTVSAAMRDEPAKIAIPPLSADAASLHGTWAATSVQVMGQNLPAESLKSFGMTFAGNRAHIKTGAVGMGGMVIDYAFTISPDRTPKEIDLEVKGFKPVQGIYELDGDRLTVCLGGAGDPRPDRFESRPDPKEARMLAEFRRESAGDVKSEPKP